MKTKNLMTAFALSAMFAACSQDTELNETIAKNDLSNIPMVEATFTADFGVDSRMATKFNLEVGDKVGFAYLGDGSIANYTGAAWQNNPLYCTDADAKSFEADGMFYVGTYFAYMPYTEGSHGIKPIPFNVTGQTLTTNSDELGKSTIYITPKLSELEKKTGTASDNADKLPSGIGNNLPLKLARVSNAATINLTFGNADGLTDLKVYGVSLYAKVGTTEVLPTSFAFAPIANSYSYNKDTWKGCPSGTFYNLTEAVTRKHGKIEATSKDGIAVVGNALTIYMLTMPKNASGAIDAFEVLVTTNYGAVTVDLTDVYGDDDDACITFTEGGKDKTITTTSLFNDFGSNGTMNVYVDMDDKVVVGGEVKTQAELEEKLTALATSGYAEPVTYTIKPANANKKGNFVLTDFTLPESLKANIILAADAGKVPNGFVFRGNTVVNKTLSLAAPAVVEGTMTVEYIKDVYTLNASDSYVQNTLTVNHGAVLINNGMMNIAVTTVAANEEEGLSFGKFISNSKDASFKNHEKVKIVNEGEVEWIAGVLPTTIEGDGPVYAEATDLAGIEAANEVVSVIRLIDGAWIGNNTEAISYDNITTIECYGNVDFYVTDTPRGAANTFGFPYAIIYVMKDATLTINSDNKNNILETGDLIAVKENAVLSITNIICDAKVNNWGEVWLNNAKQVDKGYEHEGSSWNSTENN